MAKLDETNRSIYAARQTGGSTAVIKQASTIGKRLNKPADFVGVEIAKPISSRSRGGGSARD